MNEQQNTEAPLCGGCNNSMEAVSIKSYICPRCGIVQLPPKQATPERKCQGACNAHKGDVVYVHVENPKAGTDWRHFWYCENAVRDDRDNGLMVTILDLETEV